MTFIELNKYDFNHIKSLSNEINGISMGKKILFLLCINLIFNCFIIPRDTIQDTLNNLLINNLFDAVKFQNTSMLSRFLDDIHADPNEISNNGRTLLWLAVENNDIETVKILLEDPRTDPNLQGIHELFPLYVAAEEGYDDIVIELLNHPRINVNQQIDDGTTALSIAVQKAKISTVRILSNDPRVDPNLARNDGDFPLFLASFYGNTTIVKILLRNPNINTNQRVRNTNLRTNNGATALYAASFKGDIATVEALLEVQRTNPNLRVVDGNTPLSIATQGNHTRIVELLSTDRRTDPNIVTRNGFSSLFIAACKGYREIVKILLRNPRLRHTRTIPEDRTALANTIISILQGNRIAAENRDPVMIALNNGHLDIAFIILASQNKILKQNLNQQRLSDTARELLDKYDRFIHEDSNELHDAIFTKIVIPENLAPLEEIIDQSLLSFFLGALAENDDEFEQLEQLFVTD